MAPAHLVPTESRGLGGRWGQRDSAALRLRYLGATASNAVLGLWLCHIGFAHISSPPRFRCASLALSLPPAAGFAKQKQKKRAQASLAHPFVFVWRWGRDSNSWYPYEYGSLANCWFQPLTHPTGGLYTEVTCKSDCKDTVIFEKRANFLSL